MKLDLHEHRGAVRESSSSKCALEGLVVEAELHHLRLEDDAAPLSSDEEIARVLAADLDPRRRRACSISRRARRRKRVAVARGRLRLRDEERARKERRARLRVDDADRERRSSELDRGTRFFGCGGIGLGEPGLDAAAAVRALAREEAVAGAIWPCFMARARARLPRRPPPPPPSGSEDRVRADAVRAPALTPGARRAAAAACGCAGLRRAELVAHGDEQRRDVLAVAVDLRERRTRAAAT